MRATLRNMPSEWSTRTSGPAKAPLRGRGSGVSFRRFAQGWQLWITRLKADPTAGIDLGTARHGDRRLLLPFGRTLQVSGHSDPRGVPGRLGQCPQWRCQSNQARIGRRTMALTRRMVTLHPQWARLQLRRHQQGWAFGDFCSGSNLRQQPPVRQSRLLAPHSRRHVQLRPAEDTSRVRPSCRMLLTAAFYCNRRPKRLLLERGCTDGTGPRPSIEP